MPRHNDGVAATLAPNVGLEVSRYPESWRQIIPTVGPHRGDDRVSCTRPVTSVHDSDSRVRGLLDVNERQDINDRDRLRIVVAAMYDLALRRCRGSHGRVLTNCDTPLLKSASVLTGSVHSVSAYITVILL